MKEEKTTHPSYGSMVLAQTSCNSAVLVGSSVLHNNFISLEISEATRYRNVYRDDYFSDKLLCRVEFSYAQLTELLFSINSGGGVPCTLRYVKGDDNLVSRPRPDFESPFTQSTNDFNNAIQETLGKAKEFAKESEALLNKKGSLTKKEIKHLNSLAAKIVQDIQMNIPYTAECVDEKMEKVTAQAKAEIESFTSFKLKQYGIDAIQEKLALTKEKTEELGKEV
jgi:ElaB/YqjD/DUF883 family membrane-anchored ribosome-binding protein